MTNDRASHASLSCSESGDAPRTTTSSMSKSCSASEYERQKKSSSTTGASSSTSGEGGLTAATASTSTSGDGSTSKSGDGQASKASCCTQLYIETLAASSSTCTAAGDISLAGDCRDGSSAEADKPVLSSPAPSSTEETRRFFKTALPSEPPPFSCDAGRFFL